MKFPFYKEFIINAGFVFGWNMFHAVSPFPSKLFLQAFCVFPRNGISFYWSFTTFLSRKFLYTFNLFFPENSTAYFNFGYSLPFFVNIIYLFSTIFCKHLLSLL
ncbi:hypothetical protein ACP275_12G045000 [Erythranthe tilingii]